MAVERNTGKIKEKLSVSEEKEIHWEIQDFLSLSRTVLHHAPTFRFLNIEWYLKIDPSVLDDTDDISLYLETDNIEVSYKIMCTFGIRKVDGSLTAVKSFECTFSKRNKCREISAEKIFTRSALEESASQLMPSNNLTIICKLKHLNGSLILTELNTLSENIKHLYTNEEFSDTTLHVKDTKFKAHKLILAARSTVFAAMFKHDTSEKQTGIVNILDCDPEVFQEFLVYLYCGKLDNISSSNAPHLYEIADKYKVQELKLFCVRYMSENLTTENFYDIVILAENYAETGLFAAAQKFFNKNLGEISASDEWEKFMKKQTIVAKKLLVEMASKVKIID